MLTNYKDISFIEFLEYLPSAYRVCLRYKIFRYIIDLEMLLPPHELKTTA